MDHQTTSHAPTEEERSAVDAILGPPESVFRGGSERNAADDHVAYGGLSAAQAQRNLLLPVLHEVQSSIGWVSHGATNYISERLSVSPAEAYGVATFYDLIATEARPPRVARVCDDIACLAAGAGSMLDDLTDQLGEHDQFERPAAWTRSPCLGQCEKGSAAYIQVAGGNDVVVAPATAEQIIEILSAEEPQPSAAPAPARPDTRLLARTTLSLGHHESHGGLEALRMALATRPDAIIDEVTASGLRGRGGAAFPAGIKWKAVREEAGPKYVVCNADESEPGTFKDRVLMEADPYRLIEAITIAGYAVGADKGYIYLRGEYPAAFRRITEAIDEVREHGYLGGNIAGSEFSFDIEIRKGAGAYICGEETALFNSIEGFRGEPRQKPPFPTQAGLFGRPTLVNNVESLMNIPDIVLDGGDAFASIGTAHSSGPKLFCVSGNVAEPGVYEAPFGVSTRDVIEMAGGVDGELRAVLVGGAAGSFLSEEQMDIPLTFEDTSAAGISVGSGVVMVFNSGVDMAPIVSRIAEFFRHESCGLCVPCRVGTMRQEESLTRLRSTHDRDTELALLADLDVVMRDSSICGLGQLATVAVQSAITIGLIGAES